METHLRAQNQEKPNGSVSRTSEQDSNALSPGTKPQRVVRKKLADGAAKTPIRKLLKNVFK
jgi:hypothetical protein